MNNKKLDNILYIDDEEANLLVFKTVFWQKYNIFEATNTQQAYTILKHNNIKVVITDQRMPNETGLSFIERVHNEFNQIVFIILTGYADMKFVIDAINMGHVYRFITKPWNKTELTTTIINAIDKYNLIEQNNTLLINLQKANSDLAMANEELTAASESIIENEIKYRQLFENIPNGIVLLTYKTVKNQFIINNIDVNPAFTNLTGLSVKNIFDEQNKQQPNKVFISWLNNLKKTVQLNKPFKYIQQSIDNNKYFLITLYPYCNNQIVEIVEDITERIQYEEKIKQSEQMLNTIFDNAPILMFVLNNKLEIIKINSHGINNNSNPQNFIGSKAGNVFNCKNIFNNNNIDCGQGSQCQSCSFYQIVGHTLKTGEPTYKHEFEITSEINHKETVKTYLLSTSLLNNKNNKQILVSVDDISKRKKLETDITEALNMAEYSEQRYRMLANLTFEGIIIHKDLILVDVNEAFINLTGYNKDNVIGSNILKTLFPPEYHPLILNRLNMEYSNSIEIDLIKKDGSKITIEFEGRNLKYKGQNLRVSAVRDITDRKQFEKRIMNAIIETEEKEKSKFAQELHDGLGPILSNVQLYFQWLAEETEKREFVIEKGTNSLKLAFQTLREISNNLSPHILHNFGLSKAINNFIDLAPKKHKPAISLTDKIKNSRFAPNVEIAVYRIVTELINNGLKYSEALNIDIFLNYQSQLLSIIYSDNGIGFDYDKALNKGSSYGLININNRVKILNGSISFITTPNNGTKVNIKIPV